MKAEEKVIEEMIEYFQYVEYRVIGIEEMKNKKEILSYLRTKLNNERQKVKNTRKQGRK